MSDERLQTGDLVRDDADAPIARDDSAQAGGDDPRLEPLFDDRRTQELRDRWHGLQANFVDDPRELPAVVRSFHAGTPDAPDPETSRSHT